MAVKRSSTDMVPTPAQDWAEETRYMEELLADPVVLPRVKAYAAERLARLRERGCPRGKMGFVKAYPVQELGIVNNAPEHIGRVETEAHGNARYIGVRPGPGGNGMTKGSLSLSQGKGNDTPAPWDSPQATQTPAPAIRGEVSEADALAVLQAILGATPLTPASPLITPAAPASSLPLTPATPLTPASHPAGSAISRPATPAQSAPLSLSEALEYLGIDPGRVFG